MTSSNKRLKIDTIIDRGVKNIMSKLLEDIKVTIANKLNLEDFLRFSVVCRSWHSTAMTAKKILPLQMRSQLPWLMFFPSFGNPKFFILSRDKILRLKFPRIVYGSQSVGSNYGLLIMVNKDGSVFLLNPLTEVVIELPPLNTVPIQHGLDDLNIRIAGFWSENFINKAMLLPTPAPTANNSDLDYKNATSSVAAMNYNCVVIAIYSNNALAFCTPLDKRWTALGLYYRDIILYNGKLYAITDQCDLRLVELTPRPKTTSYNIPPPITMDINPEIESMKRKAFYLVECLGDLLLVVRSCQAGDLRYYGSVTFKIFKLDLKNQRWIQVEDLGDCMLFIGKSTSSSASTRDCPQFRENCIYFTYNEEFGWEGPLVHQTTISTGVFHLKDNNIEPFSPNVSKVSLSPPVWFLPSSC